MLQRREQHLVEKLVLEAAVEGFDERVLHRLARAEDLRMATAVAVLVELTFGLGTSLTGLGALGPDGVQQILIARPDLAAQVEARLRACYAAALDLLRAHRPALQAVTGALLERGLLDGAEAAALVRPSVPAAPPVAGWRPPPEGREPGRGGVS